MSTSYAPRTDETRRRVSLSGRETEILSLIARGDCAKVVADRLFLSKRTIDYHLANAYSKLGVSNRIQAILVANRLGLIPIDPSDPILSDPFQGRGSEPVVKGPATPELVGAGHRP